MNVKRLAPLGATCAAILLLAHAATAVSVSDGFPDQGGAATAQSASSIEAFDSFAFADAFAAAPLSVFHSFVSWTATASQTLTHFNSREPVGFAVFIK